MRLLVLVALLAIPAAQALEFVHVDIPDTIDGRDTWTYTVVLRGDCLRFQGDPEYRSVTVTSTATPMEGQERSFMHSFARTAPTSDSCTAARPHEALYVGQATMSYSRVPAGNHSLALRAAYGHVGFPLAPQEEATFNMTVRVTPYFAWAGWYGAQTGQQDGRLWFTGTNDCATNVPLELSWEVKASGNRTPGHLAVGEVTSCPLRVVGNLLVPADEVATHYTITPTARTPVGNFSGPAFSVIYTPQPQPKAAQAYYPEEPRFLPGPSTAWAAILLAALAMMGRRAGT